MEKFGLRESDIDILINLGKTRGGIKKIIIFGSRATGNYKKSSDVDIAIEGKLSLSEVWQISGYLNDEALTPYFYDVVHLDSLTNETLRERICTEGKVVYQV